MSLTMTKTEREAFLAEIHVAVVSVAGDSLAPLTVPVWYSYEPGGVLRFVTGAASQKAQLIRKTGRLSLCVQTETAPYKYVSVEGPAVIGEPDFERDMRQMAYRYLGEQLGDWYLQTTADERARGTILVSLTPEHWLTVDYGKMAS